MSIERQRASSMPTLKLFVKRAWPWVVRALYLSVFLAICDCVVASRGDTIFSKRTWAMTDGGTCGYVGFGYSLTYYRPLDASLCGPVVRFWHLPFEISFARSEPEILWVR